MTMSICLDTLPAQDGKLRRFAITVSHSACIVCWSQ